MPESYDSCAEFLKNASPTEFWPYAEQRTARFPFANRVLRLAKPSQRIVGRVGLDANATEQALNVAGIDPPALLAEFTADLKQGLRLEKGVKLMTPTRGTGYNRAIVRMPTSAQHWDNPKDDSLHDGLHFEDCWALAEYSTVSRNLELVQDAYPSHEFQHRDTGLPAFRIRDYLESAHVGIYLQEEGFNWGHPGLAYTREDLETVLAWKRGDAASIREVMHLCGNEWCVHPKHFKVGSRVYNQQQRACHKILKSLCRGQLLEDYRQYRQRFCRHQHVQLDKAAGCEMATDPFSRALFHVDNACWTNEYHPIYIARLNEKFAQLCQQQPR